MKAAKILKALARRLYAALAHLVPTDQTKVCLISFPDVGDNAVEIARALLAREEDFKLVWLVRSESFAALRLKELRLDPYRITLCKGFSLRGIYHAMSAGLVFHTHGLFGFMVPRSDQFVVNLWHGMPLKTIGTYDRNKGYRAAKIPAGNVAIATSRLFQRIIARAFDLEIDQVWLTGQPRTDRLMRFAQQSEPDFILWMPTYRVSYVGVVRRDGDDQALENALADFAKLDLLLTEAAPQIVVKLHPMDILNTMDLPELRRIRFLRSADAEALDLEKLMAGAKALITDFSSAAVDFAILRRPVAFYVPDHESYHRGLVPEVVDELGFFGPRLSIVDEIAAFASETGQRSHIENCNTLLHEYYDSDAAQRIVDRSIAAIRSETYERTP